MVVIKVDKKRLENLTGLLINDLEEIFETLAVDIKRGDDLSWDLELYPDRPDLYSIFGLSRAIRQYKFQEERNYKVKKSNIFLKVDKNVSSIRPFIGAAIIRDLYLNDTTIRDIMDLQEKLHLTVGRDRKKIAIGIHDLDKVKPPFKYAAYLPEEISFIPLGFQKKMNLMEIIKNHPKGIEYAELLKDFKMYPVITDSENNVLSFPPIINGTLTQVTEKTKNIFIDVTGLDLFTVINTLDLTVTALNELSMENESVNINYPEGMMVLPDLKYEKLPIEKTEIENMLGIKMDEESIFKALKSMGYKYSMKKKKIEVGIPPYRIDIMHPVDIIEDVAKAYGFNKIEKSLPEKFSIGIESNVEMVKERLRRIMIGLGYIETINLTFTSPERNFFIFNLDKEESMNIVNPVIEDQSIYRTWLIPMLMETLKNNKHRNLPQKIFEIGEVFDGKETIHIAGVSISSNASFTEIKGVVGKFLQSLGLEMNIKEDKKPFLINGRQASIIINDQYVGFFGEMHPEIIERFDLGNPVVVFELNIERIFSDIFKDRLEF
ncbi:MAG: phenylalanine--tRNA ligase subunit beta [Thermoplasmata archaeon]